MKKNVIIVVIILVIAVGGWFVFMDKEAVPIFFSSSEVLPSDKVIHITDNGFEPADIEVKVGQRVVWINHTQDYVWPASNLHPTHEIYSEFDPKEPFDPGLAWAFEFKKTGEWAFHDHLKPSRRGTVKVNN